MVSMRVGERELLFFRVSRVLFGLFPNRADRFTYDPFLSSVRLFLLLLLESRPLLLPGCHSPAPRFFK